MGIGLRRRAADLTVLRRLGAGSALLSRAFLVEQGLVAGAGAIAGLAIGVLVSALTVPLAVLTPAAARPVPAPALVLPWGPIAALAAGLPAAILLLSWTITLRRRP
jgi:predicted lysophospholipase L1 biosynthesis ABC-type transport system permease subunit